ncbi:DUF305 domain-containing protein [Nocardia thailandica]|uniref:DUF305 domain-containing protein n=1 Tax=Nocardia farcinica (strain IFM 10152) TaxID=247156 RepID=Q5YML7_NOCFA|nr:MULTISPECIES: DUF305 domain-containing protein [Nocardia]BAD60574.1 hypothetical protein PNF1_480 [Nocardia farcinica IFM 10152]
MTSESPTPEATPPARRRSSAIWAAALVAAVIVGLLAGFWVRGVLGSDSSAPALDVVDVGFAQDMATHHNQAVEMSATALEQAEDPAVRTLAFDVLTTQQSQLGMMRGWLMLWDRPLSSEQPMLWMRRGDSHTAGTDHQMPAQESMRMPGMATTEELAQLRRARGAAFDTLYLQLLLRHHEGGVSMARAARDNATVPAVAALAKQIDDAQTAESQAIRAMLAQRGAPTLPMN